MVRLLIVMLTLPTIVGCVPPMRNQNPKVWGDTAGKTVGERAEERDAAAQGVAVAKMTSAQTQSAIVLANKGNEMCYVAGRANYAGAQTAYREALDLEPNNTFVLAARATCYARQGMEEKFSGKGGQASTDTKRLREAQKWFKRAQAACRQALKINQNYGTAHLILAEIYALDNRPEKALETLNLIESQNLIPRGRESGFYAWRAYTRFLMGESPEADADKAEEYYDPVEFAEYVDRLLNPEDYKGLPPPSTPVAPLP